LGNGEEESGRSREVGMMWDERCLKRSRRRRSFKKVGDIQGDGKGFRKVVMGQGGEEGSEKWEGPGK
jgi:hypothetical protein